MQDANGRRRAGFTLIELMVVVAILGVLATVALPQYKSYVYRSKTTEAVGFLAEIKARQESYRADFGEYLNVSGAGAAYAAGDESGWYPASAPGPTPGLWPDTDPVGLRWRQLGAAPPGRQVYFRYVTVAGRPGTTPGWSGGLGYTGNDFWFVSRARANLDGDAKEVIFESYSHGQGLFIDNPAGWE